MENIDTYIHTYILFDIYISNNSYVRVKSQFAQNGTEEDHEGQCKGEERPLKVFIVEKFIWRVMKYTHSKICIAIYKYIQFMSLNINLRQFLSFIIK